MNKRLEILAALLLMATTAACAGPIRSVSPATRESETLAALMEGEIRLAEGQSLDPGGLAQAISNLSHLYDLDPLLVLAIIKVESGFKPAAVSPAGAIGLMQVMPIVVRAVGDEVDVRSRRELFDPYKNLLLGIHYFTVLRGQYRDNLSYALAAYNLGPAGLNRHLNRHRFIPTGYVRKVTRSYEEFRRKVTVLRVASRT